MQENNIKIVIVYFGKFPLLADYFFASCLYNKDFTFLLFTDQLIQKSLPENVCHYPFSKKDFRELVARKTGLRSRLRNPYKLCDFKPLYGHIFEDFLHTSAFWGYCDVDMILGKMSHFISPEILQDYDIITARKSSLAGNFTLFRNTKKFCTLYRENKCWKIILSDPYTYYGFDEQAKVHPINLTSSISSLLYKFIRFKGKKICRMADMNQVISNTPDIKIYYGNFILSDEILKNRKVNNWKIQWKSGILTYIQSNREIMYFHFFNIKKASSYNIPKLEDGDNVSSLLFTDQEFKIDTNAN